MIELSTIHPGSRLQVDPSTLNPHPRRTQVEEVSAIQAGPRRRQIELSTIYPFSRTQIDLSATVPKRQIEATAVHPSSRIREIELSTIIHSCSNAGNGDGCQNQLQLSILPQPASHAPRSVSHASQSISICVEEEEVVGGEEEGSRIELLEDSFGLEGHAMNVVISNPVACSSFNLGTSTDSSSLVAVGVSGVEQGVEFVESRRRRSCGWRVLCGDLRKMLMDLRLFFW